MKLFRILINNTFFMLLLLVAATIYIALSDSIKKDHGIMVEVKHEVERLMEHKPVIADKDSGVAENMAHVDVLEQNKLEQNKLEQPVEKTAINSTNKSVQKEIEEVAQTEVTRKTVIQTEIEQAEHSEVQVKKNVKTESVNEQSEIMAVVHVKQPEPVSQDQAVNHSVHEKASSQSQSDSTVINSFMSKEEAQAILKEYVSSQAVFNAALKAYQEKDYIKAEKLLFALSLWRPTPQILGALGNVFYTNQKHDWAKRAWAAAANLLIRQGNLKAAKMHAQAINKVAPDLNQQIQQRIQEALTKNK